MPSPIDLLVPLVVSLAAMLIGRRRVEWIAPAAVAAGFASWFPTITGALPGFPPLAATGWLLYIAIFAGLFGCALAWKRLGKVASCAIVALVVGLSIAAVLRLRIVDPDSRMAALLWVAAATLGVGGWVWALDAIREDVKRLLTPLAIVLLTLFSAALLTMSHSVVYGRLGLALGGAAAPLVAAGLAHRPSRWIGIALATCAPLSGLLIAGHWFADLSLPIILLLGVAPYLLPLPKYLLRPHAHRWKYCVISLTLFMLSIIAAVLLILPDFIRQLSADANPYGE